ncbi:MAG: PLP-dependent aminotransferase family protein [Anaerofustis sp.]
MITLNTDANNHLYVQLYLELRSKILGGQLAAGTKLPSKRRLSEDLHISQNTVDTAYQQLVSEGYLNAVAKSGFYVEEILPESMDKIPCAERCTEKIEDTAEKEIIWDFGIDRVDTERFPFATWVRLTKEIMHDENRTLLQRAHPQGDRRLREAVTDYLWEYRGIRCGADRVLIGAGTEYLFQLLMQILGRQRVVALENPGYEKTAKILKKNEIATRYVPVGAAGIDLDLLELSDADTAYVTPSHQFPLGVVMPVVARRRLLKWASEGCERYIIEDDYDHEFRYDGRPIPALKGMDEYDRVIYIGTFSRSIAPSVRISYMVMPDALMNRYREEFLFYSCPVSRFEQDTLSRFLTEGHYGRHINRMKKLYRSRRDCLIRELGQTPFAWDADISGTEAGLHLLVSVKNKAKAGLWKKSADESGVDMHELAEYCFDGIGKRFEGIFLFGYAHMNESDMREGIALLNQLWDESAPIE